VPTVIVYGIPASLRGDAKLRELVWKDLPVAAASVAEMDIDPQKVVVFAPDSLESNTDGTEIVVFVEGLFVRPQRTPEVLQRFADAICDCVANFATQALPSCRKVEIIPRSQQSSDGFAYWKKPTELSIIREQPLLARCQIDPTVDKVRTELIRAIRRNDQSGLDEAWLRFRKLAEAYIDGQLSDENDAHSRAQIQLILIGAAVWHEAGRRESCLEDLRDAYDYANNMGFLDLVKLIDATTLSIEAASQV